MTANTLTGLIPTIYAAKDIVLRELTGFIPAVTLDASGDQAAKDQTIQWPIAAIGSADDIAAAATGPDPAGVTHSYDNMTISKSRSVTFHWTGEEQMGLGGMYGVLLRDQFAQCMRTLVNEVEADLAALYIYASRAYGTAGTTPFGTAGDFSALAEVYKILADNGAPIGDLQCVINTAAGAKLRGIQVGLAKVNESGTDSMLRRAALGELFAFQMRESAQVKTHTPGAASGFQVDLTAGYAVGSTTVHIDTGTGEVKAGDVLTNTKTARDTNKYVVKTGKTGDSDKDIVLANPGLKVAWVNNDPVSVSAAYAANLAFSRSAIHLMMRTPAMPGGGDAADDVTTITDEQTGISFQVAMYRQRRRIAYEVGLAWGQKVIKSEALAILLG